jgi:hypothetical protein
VTKPQKFFRLLWRINAVLILIAMGAIAFGAIVLIVQETAHRARTNRDTAAPSAIGADDSELNLQMGRTSLVPGTGVLRTDLTLRRESDKFSSGGGSETRNILFIDPNEKKGRWLLPDNKHILGEISDITERSTDAECESGRPIATAVVVKDSNDSETTGKGKLLLFDPTGKKVIEVANDVSEIHLASLTGNEVVILYERNSRLVRTAFSRDSLVKQTELEIDLPKIK